MTDLDMKLIDKYNEIGRSFYWEGTLGEEDCQEEALAFAKEIKQAFIDADWTPNTVKRYTSIEDLPDHIMVFNDATETWDRLRVKDLQKEWYDRFADILDSYDGIGIGKDNTAHYDVRIIHQAAGEASGIE